MAPINATLRALAEAVANPGIRRLEASWLLGIAADGALTVALLVVAYELGGVVAAGLLGAVRMGPAVVSGMLSGAILARFRGDRVLIALAVTRTASAALCAWLIATGPTLPPLFVLAGLAAAAGAPVRPVQATLMPALARSPSELVASNMAWSTGEGLGALAGPFVAGVLVAAGMPATAAALAALGFGATALVTAGLRFEQAEDALGATTDAGSRGIRLLDGLRALRRRRVPGWSMIGVFGQVATRGALNVLVVVAAIELLGMGEGGVGLLNAAFGLGALVGAVFAVSLARSGGLIRTQAAALAWWGAPLAVIGLLPIPSVGLGAMVVVGIANAMYDVAVLTIMQRGCTNAERAPVFAVFEGVAGLGYVSGSLVAPLLLAALGPRGALALTGAFLPILSLLVYSRIGRADRVAVVDEATHRLLRDVAEFEHLPLTAIERLAEGLVVVTYTAGEMLMRQGEPGDRFIVIDRGEVDVSVDGRFVHRLGHGAGLGEIALIRRSPRTATVTAVTDVTGYCLSAGTFLAAIAGPAAAAVTERIAEASLARTRAELTQSESAAT
jgi:MFS family permease